MNKFYGIGNLTKDPDMRTTGTGKSVTSFTIAINRRFGEGVDYIPVVVWGAAAENCKKYLLKGSKVGVSGSLQIRSYQDKNGNNRQAFEINADEVEFLNRAEARTEEKPKEEIPVEENPMGTLLDDFEDNLPF